MGSGFISNENLEYPPVKLNERLYRRLLKAWYQPGSTKPIPQKLFMPRPWKSEEQPGDTNGLSVNRAQYIDLEDMAKRPDNGQLQHVVELGVCDVQELGLSVKIDFLPNNPSHALIPELNSIDRRDPDKEAQMEEWAKTLQIRAKLVFEAP